ncbi:nucleoside-diphosphate sugar epimerase/dehydratase [Brevundimonas halotolerans]|uniref:O-antigen biosynthesis protein WbqV n=1 Tax=Brevundimonas halotolerans TaxID=69670 RepID=A0A7W9E7W3_9CAUL|nr:nucleoside-diphosphate sugar epimerase/dehydratase [Brevundimonas halotolerans]MBB5661401.1 O-antigen biosynthesis protein WbqV [Brevundimonas halotolerans]
MRASLTATWAAKYLIHIGALFVGFLLAYELRRALPIEWWFQGGDAIRVIGWAALYALIGALVEAVFQTERTAWRFASVRDVVALGRNVVLTVAFFLLAIFAVDRGVQLPRSVIPLTAVLSVLFLVGVRLLWRLPRESELIHHLLPTWWRKISDDRTPLILVGSLADADRQIRLLQADADQPYQPVGIVTPDVAEVGMRLQGVPAILALEVWRDQHIPFRRRDEPVPGILFLQDPVHSFGLTPQRVGELKKAGHTLLRPHVLTEVGAPGPRADLLTEIPLEEFLPRQPISLPTGPVEDLIRGKRILVTGAGGSIGSEIARQMVQLGCGHLTLLDHSEFQLFEIDRELGGVKTAMTRRAVLANVRDEARIREVFDQERPDIVFHAAALKHVALVENNPAEGVLTNVQGTWNVIRAATAAKAAQFVLISTDKAVDPSNVMGATKRIAETLLELVPESGTRLSAVRFGNVLGSAGSVVPIFRDQIARGGPVTVTHPDVNRYFMTIPEAVQLVLHSTAVKAARADEGPSKFLLEMGEPVRIADLARQMIELSGKTPDVDIKIEYTGLKQGEKIAEILSDDGEDPRPCVDGILEVMGRTGAGRLDTARLQTLVSAARMNAGHEVTMLLSQAIADVRAPRDARTPS